jgi:hypothetical protein
MDECARIGRSRGSGVRTSTEPARERSAGGGLTASRGPCSRARLFRRQREG